MGKAHRDNHAARLKRGDKAFKLKLKRRAAVKKRETAKCPIHGGFDCECRKEKEDKPMK